MDAIYIIINYKLYFLSKHFCFEKMFQHGEMVMMVQQKNVGFQKFVVRKNVAVKCLAKDEDDC